MARVRQGPLITAEELSGVGGIGAAKLERYGEELLAVLASDCQVPQP